MKVKICKACGKEFLDNANRYYCRICSKKWHEKQDMRLEMQEEQKWQEEKQRNRDEFEKIISAYTLIDMNDIIPLANTLYIVGNGFDLMHRVPSSYYYFRDSLGKKNRLRDTIETALTAEDIWADFENALGSLNLDLMAGRHTVDMWLDDFGFYEDGGAAEFNMAVEAAAAPVSSLVEKLQPAFHRWVNSLKIGTDDKPLADLIHPDGKVLNFNYTEFVETLYGVHDICYIHGSRKKKEKLILGHRPGASGVFHEKKKKARSYRQAVTGVAQDNVFDLIGQYDEELTKNSQEIIRNHQAFFEELKGIQQIVVIGHSISRVDWDYFAEVKNKTGNAQWYFGIFGLNDLKNMEDLIQTMDIQRYRVFRTDIIRTKPNRTENEKPRSAPVPKPRVYKHDHTVVTIYETYDMIIDEGYELVLPAGVRKTVFIGDYLLLLLGDPEGSILLFRQQNKNWSFVNCLNSFEHQSLINRRLTHIYVEESLITFVFNNRIRVYDLNSGKMVDNKQLRNAKSSHFSGTDIMKQFVG